MFFFSFFFTMCMHNNEDVFIVAQLIQPFFLHPQKDLTKALNYVLLDSLLERRKKNVQHATINTRKHDDVIQWMIWSLHLTQIKPAFVSIQVQITRALQQMLQQTVSNRAERQAQDEARAEQRRWHECALSHLAGCIWCKHAPLSVHLSSEMTMETSDKPNMMQPMQIHVSMFA